MELGRNLETFDFLKTRWPLEDVIKAMMRLNRIDQKGLSHETQIPISCISMTISRKRNHVRAMAAISRKLGIPSRELFDGKR